MPDRSGQSTPPVVSECTIWPLVFSFTMLNFLLMLLLLKGMFDELCTVSISEADAHFLILFYFTDLLLPFFSPSLVKV